MAWGTTKQFDFRATAGFTTDNSNGTYVLDTTSYPTTRTIGGDSVTFGWETAPDGARDRITSAPNDPILDGICYMGGTEGTTAIFRVDLPATGNYGIRIAAGDPSNQYYAYSDVKDNATILFSQSDTQNGGADYYFDSSGVDRTSAANWIAANVEVTQTFSSTIFRYILKSGAAASAYVISHIELRQAAATPTATIAWLRA